MTKWTARIASTARVRRLFLTIALHTATTISKMLMTGTTMKMYRVEVGWEMARARKTISVPSSAYTGSCQFNGPCSTVLLAIGLSLTRYYAQDKAKSKT